MEKNKKYCLLGQKLSHSLSPYIHKVIMREMNINGEYNLLEIEESQLSYVIDEIKKGRIDGMNVTIPYKEKILSFIDINTDIVNVTNSTNTIMLNDEISQQTISYNTDWFGFDEMCRKYNVDFKDKNVVILGYGGVSKTVTSYVAQKNCNNIIVFSRKKGITFPSENIKAHSYEDPIDLKGTDIVINTTPIGMKGNVSGNPLDLLSEKREEIYNCASTYIDLIYNPTETIFLKKAREISNSNKAINGLDMLIYQAIYAQLIWNKVDLSHDEIEGIYNKVLDSVFLKNNDYKKSKKSIIITGLPFSGKTTLIEEIKRLVRNNGEFKSSILKNEEIEKLFNYQIVDLDEEIIKYSGSSISELFKKSEEVFRSYEKKALEKLVKDEKTVIIAAGGGVLKDQNNRKVIRDNFINIMVDRNINEVHKVIDYNSRPLIKSFSDYEEIHKERYNLYKASADYIIDNNSTIEDMIYKFIKIMGEINENTCN